MNWKSKLVLGIRGYALAYLCNSKRRVVSARRTGGTVSGNCRVWAIFVLLFVKLK
jgi:hypothetical protein